MATGNSSVRRVTTGDAALWQAAVRAVVPPEDREHRLATLDDLASAVSDETCYLYVATIAKLPVGIVTGYRFPDVECGGHIVYLYDIVVANTHRRQGIGVQLVNKLVEDCETDGVRLIWAGTDVANNAARRTFESTEAELEGESYVEYEWDLED